MINKIYKKINSGKSYLMTAFAVFTLVFSFPGHAKKGAKKISYEQTVALSSANLINRYKTVGQFVQIFKPHMNAKDYRDLKKSLISKSVSLKDKLPKVRAKGNKIFVASGGGVIEVKNSKTFVINGHTFKGSTDKMATRFESIYTKLSKKKKSRISLLSVVVPEAHAFGDLMGIVSIFGAGLGGYYLGPKLGVKKSTGALLGVGGIYLATELWQSFKNGDVTCTDDGRYQERTKGRNMWFMAMSEQTIISSAKVREAGLGETCTKANAEALKVWAEEQGNLHSPAQEPAAAASSTAIYGE